jgi:hypothetical protein
MFEPYAMKVARTVLRGGKSERTHLSQLFNSMIHEKSYHNLNRINLSNRLVVTYCWKVKLLLLIFIIGEKVIIIKYDKFIFSITLCIGHHETYRSLFIQVLHGCFQLMLWNCGKSHVINVNPSSICKNIMIELNHPLILDLITGTKTSHHGLNIVGWKVSWESTISAKTIKLRGHPKTYDTKL